MESITNSAAVRALYPAPKERVLRKVLPCLDTHCARFIALSPFCVLASVDADDCPDMSPRGGAPGFVQLLDEHTLLLLDRPGNNRLDSLSHVADRPAVALLFFVPGVDEVLRVYGTATILPAGSFEHERDAGKPAVSALKISVQRAFFHCAKALMRAHLWSEDARIDRACFPTLGEIMHDQLGETTPAESQEEMICRFLPEF
ncbi:MAG TPA: MSMEG_1061 family FMN-dependent PPOX-type flavoprotein [Chloroflexota bacterium]|nr:MSMEG_1061 family FMN-dependent PPOX-type flavoprotein [Chloroflexota bacterium]